jgi:hypothetical protein
MSKRAQRFLQLELFQPPRVRPHWRDLPADLRQTVTQILAKILLEHHARKARQKGEGGPTHD